MRPTIRPYHGVLIGMAVLVSACSASHQPQESPAAVTHFPGLPSGVTQPAELQQAWAEWGTAPGSIYVMTLGSSRCPQLPSSVRASGIDTVVIRTSMFNAGGVCTNDLAVTTSVVRLPSAVSTAHPVRVIIDGATTHLSPAPTPSPSITQPPA
jgi:hypothetical protein